MLTPVSEIPGRMGDLVCPLCHSADHRRLYQTTDWHYGIRGDYELRRCLHCDVWFLAPPLGEAELFALYPQDYYAYAPPASVPPRLRRFVRRALGFKMGTCDPPLPPAGRLLDLGCGSGTYLLHKKAAGWEVCGLEPSAAAAAAGQRAGLDIRAGTLRAARFPSDYFDFVHSNHSFEHIPNPRETLDEIFRITKPNGRVLLGIPNTDGLARRLFGPHWWYSGVPLHVLNYSPRAIRNLLREHGFRVDRIHYNSDYAGLLGSFQIRQNHKQGRRCDDGIWWRNLPLRVAAQWSANVLDWLRFGDCIEVLATKPEREARTPQHGLSS